MRHLSRTSVALSLSNGFIQPSTASLKIVEPEGAAAIDPTTQPVKVTLSTAAGFFYTKTITGFDVRGRVPNRRWTATAAARAAAGIDACVIDEDPNNDGSFFLRDVNTTVAMADFTNTSLDLGIGPDQLTGLATMVERPILGGGRGRLQSEP